jgi:N6-L-threonylcarbamoyladenine synthase
MIAWAGIERLRAGIAEENAFDFVPRSRWPLDSVSAPMIGSGRRGAKA